MHSSYQVAVFSWVTLFFMAATVSHAGTFGQAGPHGRSAQSGRSGRSVPASTVRVTGQPLQFNLSGEDGTDGLPGESGGDAYSCFQPHHVRENLYGAPGGNASQGGYGGSGGNGGDVTLVYSDRAHLSQIQIYAPGGRGARGGQSGRGGHGCYCTNSFWTVRHCVKNPQGQEVCTDERYSCTNGNNGSSPAEGPNGSDGAAGSILLVHSSKTITPDSPYTSVTLGSAFGAGAGSPRLTLTRNLYTSIPAVAGLLAPGSVVAYNGAEFNRQKSVPVSFSWRAPQLLASFANEGVQLGVDAAGNLNTTFGDNIWIDSSTTNNVGATDQASVEVRAAYRPQEIGNLSFSYIANNGRNTEAQVDDLNRLPTDVPVSFSVLVENKVVIVWKDRYFGEVPSSLVQKVGNQYRIAVGQMGVDPTWLTGRRTRITVTANFSLGGQSKSVRVARIASL